MYKVARNVFWRYSTVGTDLTTLLLSLSSSLSAAPFELTNLRGGDAAVLERPQYGYLPTIMLDGVHKIWWCGGVGRDHILYSEASSLSGPWSRPRSVFEPTGNGISFDANHTCDPSVIRVNGRYYIYYGGLLVTDPMNPTRIGVASSDDGLTWTRLNGGQPIIRPRISNVSIYETNDEPCDDGRDYGAGQPSVIYLGGYFYLMYTDTTGIDSDRCTGIGQYVLRSRDPLFQNDVEVRAAAGFLPRTVSNQTSHSVLAKFSVDWVYSDVINQFIIAAVNGFGKISVRLYDRSVGVQTQIFNISAEWREGPGIVKRPDGHALPSPSGLRRIAIDLIRSVGDAAPAFDAWDLAHVGADLETFYSLEQLRTENRIGKALEGFRLETSGLPLAFVRNGERLQFELAAPAMRLSRNVYKPSPEAFRVVPYAASMYSGSQVVQATGQAGAFVLDEGLKWPVSCPEIVTDNQSTITQIPLSQYQAIGIASHLFCLE